MTTNGSNPRVLLAFAVTVALSTGCAHRQVVGDSLPVQKRRPEVGLASYYHASLEGGITASGERYRGAQLTCAHRTLPFDSRVRVTNLENGRTVVVRVNDRGPFVEGRVVDLSAAAARRLDLHEAGVARVRIDLLSVPSMAQANTGPPR